MANEPTLAEREAKTLEDNIAEAQELARKNHEAETAGLPDEAKRFDQLMDDSRETAKLNHEVDVKHNTGLDSGVPIKNDTSTAGKQNTAKSQLDPEGQDPISDKEVNDSATDADMTTGNKTAVDNKENAKRARHPGRAEEKAPLSTANGGPDHKDVPDHVAHANKYQPGDKLAEAMDVDDTSDKKSKSSSKKGNKS